MMYTLSLVLVGFANGAVFVVVIATTGLGLDSFEEDLDVGLDGFDSSGEGTERSR